MNLLDNFFCKNIKFLRVQNRLSKKEMAKKLKIGIKSLSAIENGNIPKRLKVDVLIRIHQVFGASPSLMVFCDLSQRDVYRPCQNNGSNNAGESGL